MLSAIEKPKKLVSKKNWKNRELIINEASKLLYTVNNNRHQKKEAGKKPLQDVEVGLPPQPKEYLKYPDYDWF